MKRLRPLLMRRCNLGKPLYQSLLKASCSLGIHSTTMNTAAYALIIILILFNRPTLSQYESPMKRRATTTNQAHSQSTIFGSDFRAEEK